MNKTPCLLTSFNKFPKFKCKIKIAHFCFAFSVHEKINPTQAPSQEDWAKGNKKAKLTDNLMFPKNKGVKSNFLTPKSLGHF